MEFRPGTPKDVMDRALAEWHAGNRNPLKSGAVMPDRRDGRMKARQEKL